ncbi:MAG: hypothetical protein D6765_11010 [Bacteroidetes bacterium]|nr:MAG: hypothetical protein D6765_11010 [Bacteroidota bacterium]
MKNAYPLALLACLWAATTLAQPANDECSDALVLTDVTNFCSQIGAFSNEDATGSALIEPSCWPQGSGGADVWFRFVAQGTDVNITVVGNTAGNPGPGGTLNSPQFALYEGDCSGGLTEIQCASDGFGFNIAETLAGPLTVGATYFIRVGAREGNRGTFQLCVNNFNQVPEPTSDCPTGVVLCDKNSFTVEAVNSPGQDPNELVGVSCIQQEFSSAWYKWTCKDPGTLAFTLTPNNPSDDLDFVVFELPNGIEDCTDKIELRCVSSGENVGAPFDEWAPCTGPTGLSLSSTDTQEFPGCAPGDDNFAAAIDMEAGKSYALVVINFSNTGSGFSVEFGGTGTFLGPEADFQFSQDAVCTGDPITFTDNSTAVTPIAQWEWSFGPGASPASATGPGPHTVTYATPGTKSIVLTITSEAGCIVTDIEEITVYPTPELEATASPDYCGPNFQTGSLTLHPSGGTPPYQFEFNNSGTLTSDTVFSQLAFGTYPVRIVDANGCSAEFTFEVPEGLALDPQLEPVIPPTCTGNADASIVVTIEVGTFPVTYDFGNGPQSDSILSGIPAGTYTVHVVDAVGCEGEFTIVVEDPPPLEVEIDALDISCFGEMDGMVTALSSGGTGEHSYLWEDSSTVQQRTNLPQGTYSVTVEDENGCRDSATATVQEPPELFLELVSVTDVLCAGEASGEIVVAVSGGTPPFQFSTDGSTFQDSPRLGGLTAGTYEVIVRDARGCTQSLSAQVDEPPPLVLDLGADQTVNLGATAVLNAKHSPPNLPVTFSWSNTEDFQGCTDCPNPTVLPLRTTTYTLTIQDPNGCTATDSVTIFVVEVRPVYAPNVFSPNDDGINDRFTLFGGPAALRIRTLKVFSRWGSLVFEANDIPLNDESLGWDGSFKGQELDPAVFAWMAEIEFIDGVVILFKGDVSLLR